MSEVRTNLIYLLILLGGGIAVFAGESGSTGIGIAGLVVMAIGFAAGFSEYNKEGE